MTETNKRRKIMSSSNTLPIAVPVQQFALFQYLGDQDLANYHTSSAENKFISNEKLAHRKIEIESAKLGALREMNNILAILLNDELDIELDWDELGNDYLEQVSRFAWNKKTRKQLFWNLFSIYTVQGVETIMYLLDAADGKFLTKDDWGFVWDFIVSECGETYWNKFLQRYGEFYCTFQFVLDHVETFANYWIFESIDDDWEDFKIVISTWTTDEQNIMKQSLLDNIQSHERELINTNIDSDSDSDGDELIPIFKKTLKILKKLWSSQEKVLEILN